MSRSFAAAILAMSALLDASIAIAEEPAAPPPKATDPAPAAPSSAAGATTIVSAPPASAPSASAPSASPGAGVEAKTIEVRVIGSAADALRKIPGSGQIVARKEIARAEPADVAEMLRRVPGVLARQEIGGGSRLDISVRGLNAQRSRDVLVLEDGVPVANNPYGEPDLFYSTPIQRVRGIEVVKGSGSILFGPETIGGVVHFLTFAPPSSRVARLAIDGGAPGHFEALGRYGDAHGDVRYIAQAFGKTGRDARGEAYYAADAFAKIALPISDRNELTAKIGFHDDGANTTDLGLTAGMFTSDPRRPTLAPFDWAHTRRVDGSLLHRAQISESVELRTLAYVTSTSRLWRRQDYDRLPVAGVPYERILGDVTEPLGAIYFRGTSTIRDRSYTVFGAEPRLTYRFATGSVQHTLEAGARFLFESAHRAERSGDQPTSDEGSLLTDEDDGSTAIAGYIQDRVAFGDHVIVTPGVRFEHAAQTRDIHRAYVSGKPADVDLRASNSFFAPLPGIGLVLGTPQIHGFGGAHIGFAAPRTATAIRVDGIHPQLDPEIAIHYEAGVRAAPARFVRAEATLFLSLFQNQVLAVSGENSATADLVNAGRTRHLGAEIAARVEIGRALRLPVTLDLYAAYTALSATFASGANAGHTLPYAPQHTASAVIDVEHPIGLGAQAAWTFVGSQFADEESTRAVDVTGRLGEIPAYNLLDFALRYTHRATGLGASVTMKNALDQIYVVSRRPDGVFPAGFRQILASVRWTYGDD